MRVSKHLPEIQTVIDRLESFGLKVRLHHNPEEEGVLVSEHGSGVPYRGVTTFDTSDGEGNYICGSAYCGLHDQFSRVTGTKVAFNRFVHELSARFGRDQIKDILE